VTVLLLLAGFALLLGGAEVLVRGASHAASAAGVAPIVIGLTVVAFATSTPELAVTTAATFRGDDELALGNVIGSNIANILLILGASALVAPLVVHRRIIRLEVPLLIAASVLVLLLALNGHLGRGEGALLVAGGAAYTAFLVREAHKNGSTVRHANRQDTEGRRGRLRALAVDLVLMIAGIGLLVLGSRWLVDAAEAIARAAGVSELAIGLTIVAVGTSLPELATSVVASVRGERDLAVGNLIGSNLFNLLFILGIASVVAPGGLTAAPVAVAFDLPIMIAVSVACIPIFFTDHTIGRWEGGAFLAFFIAYSAYVLMAASGHEAVDELGDTMLHFVLPLTALTLVVATFRELRRRG
jgi:cation:H+ antiporter